MQISVLQLAYMFVCLVDITISSILEQGNGTCPSRIQNTIATQLLHTSKRKNFFTPKPSVKSNKQTLTIFSRFGALKS